MTFVVPRDTILVLKAWYVFTGQNKIKNWAKMLNIF